MKTILSFLLLCGLAQGQIILPQLSTTGGASKVLQMDGSGNLYTGPLDNRSGGVYLSSALSGIGNIFIPDQQGLIWRDPANGNQLASLRHWRGHDGFGGEAILQSVWRIALIPNGPLQIGPNDAGRYPRKIQLVSGYADDADPSLEYMPSGALAFQTNVWDGATSQANELTFQAHALDTTGTNSILRLWDESSVSGQEGGGGVYDDGLGDVSGNLIAEFYRDGIWSAGTAPAFDSLPDGETITQTCSKYKTVQAGSVTLEGNRTLAFSGMLAGMRGVIYVTQDGVGNRTLTPSGGSALSLSTTADLTDKVEWEYDGVFVNFKVTQDIQREVVIADADALAFIAAASITDATQKAAINTLVESLKAESLWAGFYAIYPFVGGNATAHSIDLKGDYNITADGSAAGLAWQAATHNANGVTGDGTSSYGVTGVNFNTLSAQDSASLYVYNRASSLTTLRTIIGGFNTQRAGIVTTGSNLSFDGLNTTSTFVGTIANGGSFAGHIYANRSSSTTQEFHFDGTTIAANSTSSGALNQAITVLARGRATPDQFSNANLAFAAIGPSRTAGQWTTFMTIVDTFQTTLGRANP